MGEQNPGNEFFQLVKHILQRVDDTTIDGCYMSKFAVKKLVATDFCEFFLAQQEQVADLLTVHQIYSKISRLHQWYERTDDIFTVYQDKLNKILQQNVKQFVRKQLQPYVQKFLITTNAEHLIAYLDQIQQ